MKTNPTKSNISEPVKPEFTTQNLNLALIGKEKKKNTPSLEQINAKHW